MNKLLIYFLILLFLHKFIWKILIKELFSPSEDNSKYIPLNKKFCLFTKKILPNGGEYNTEIKEGSLPKLHSNQQIKFFNNDFTEQDCIDKNIGSGRVRGGFECVDFITQKMAKKYHLEFSKKTCFDKLHYIPDYPDYNTKLNE